MNGRTSPRAGTELVSGVTNYIYPAPFASTAAVGASNASATGDPGNDLRPACSTRLGPHDEARIDVPR